MLLLLAVILSAARLPWLEADAGNRAFWTYGFFVTDEGFYTHGGRIAHLEGRWVDPQRAEPHTFASNAGMHGLAWLGYRLCGLTYGAARLPAVIASILAWLLVFLLTARILPVWKAFGLTLLISLNPLSLTYERVASTDTAMGCFLMLAVFGLSTNGFAPALMGGMAFALGFHVKGSILAFLPLLVFLSGRHIKRWRHVAVFWLSAAAGLAAMRTFIAHQLQLAERGWPEWFNRGDFFRGGGLPLNIDWERMLRAASVYPRYPNELHLGPLLVWGVILPLFTLGWAVERWKREAATGVVYSLGAVAAVAVFAPQDYANVRYLLPVVVLIPMMIGEAIAIQTQGLSKTGSRWRSLGVAGLAVLIVGMVWWRMPLGGDLDALRSITNLWNAPADIAWRYTYPVILGVAVPALLAAAWSGEPIRSGWLGWRKLPLVFCALAAAALLASCKIHLRHVQNIGPAERMGIGLGVAGAIAVIAGMRSFADALKGWMPHALLSVTLLLAALANPVWHAGIQGLAGRSFVSRNLGRSLAKQLPPESIILGERAGSLLRATPLSLGYFSPHWSGSNFADRVDQLIRSHSPRPVFLLVDPVQQYQWNYLNQNNRGRFRFHHVKELRQPAVHDGTPFPLHVVYIEPLARGD